VINIIGATPIDGVPNRKRSLSVRRWWYSKYSGHRRGWRLQLQYQWKRVQNYYVLGCRTSAHPVTADNSTASVPRRQDVYRSVIWRRRRYIRRGSVSVVLILLVFRLLVARSLRGPSIESHSQINDFFHTFSVFRLHPIVGKR